MNGRSLKRDNRFTVGNDVLVTIPQAMYGGKGGWRLPGVGRGGAGKGWIQPINRPRTVIGKVRTNYFSAYYVGANLRRGKPRCHRLGSARLGNERGHDT